MNTEAKGISKSASLCVLYLHLYGVVCYVTMRDCEKRSKLLDTITVSVGEFREFNTK